MAKMPKYFINCELAHRYIVREELGRGMHGIVFKGEDKQEHKAVAIKIIDMRKYEQEKLTK